MKINSLQIENVKRVKAVTLEPTPNGLTIIGGKNGQGKTSILDAIAWALGGDRFRPSSAQREDSVIPPVRDRPQRQTGGPAAAEYLRGTAGP